jgi:hypothetical protein
VAFAGLTAMVEVHDVVVNITTNPKINITVLIVLGFTIRLNKNKMV